MVSKVPFIRRKVDADACAGCMKCAKSCDMDAVTNKGKATDVSSCLLCLECADSCPKNAISLGLKPELTNEIPSRRTALAVLGGTVAAATLAPLATQAVTQEVAPIRPPGVSNEDLFLSKCIRCGECIASCPTKVLQPAFLQYGVNALWTPGMNFSAGSCDHSCNACGSVCPTGAIEHLALKEKRAFVIGTAVIDQAACRGCGICVRVCPVQGAITAGESLKATGTAYQTHFGGRGNHGMRGAYESQDGYGGMDGARDGYDGARDRHDSYNDTNGTDGARDYGTGDSGSTDGSNKRGTHGAPLSVDASKCIGCGKCEAACPMHGNKAIKVVRSGSNSKTGSITPTKRSSGTSII